jgi:molecular chaperone DnaJ
MRRDYYAVLGVAATAAPREVRRAYRQLARQYSPDVNFWEAQAQALFEEIAEAYRILSDPTARALYDRFGHVMSGEALEAGRRGEDVHLAVELSFADAAQGASLELGVPRFSACDACRASGRAAGHLCAGCRGRGVRRAVDVVSVSLPGGVDSGTQIRVRGEGSAGPFGGPRGDLIVSTRVHEHPFFKRQGEGTYCELPLSVWEALRGARVQVPTPAGQTTLVIPSGTAAGQVFRLRGQGLPRLAGEGRGDLYVTVRVELPHGLDSRTDELVRELERLSPLTPRENLGRYVGGGL